MVRKALTAFNLWVSAPPESGRIPYTRHTPAVLVLSVASSTISLTGGQQCIHLLNFDCLLLIHYIKSCP